MAAGAGQAASTRPKGALPSGLLAPEKPPPVANASAEATGGSLGAVERVAVAGKELEVEWFAPPLLGRPTIVLLHEALGSVEHWKRFPRRLAERCGCGVMAYSR